MSEQVKPVKTIKIGDWSFNELRLEDKNLYDNFLSKTQYPTDVFSWNFAFIWGESCKRSIVWKIIDDMLVTFQYSKKGYLDLWCMPFGAGDVDKVVQVLYKCLKYCDAWNVKRDRHAKVRAINSPQLQVLTRSSEFNKLFRDKRSKGIERVISIDKLLNMQGKEYEQFRRKLNQFRRYFPEVKIRKYKSRDYEGLMQLQQYWLQTSGKKYRSIFDNVTYPAIIKHHDKLDHLILVAELNGEIVGMVSGGISPGGYSWNCYIKARNEIRGINETLMTELAREIKKNNPNIDLLNVGSDLGQKGLADFKEKYRPVIRMKRYSIRLKY